MIWQDEKDIFGRMLILTNNQIFNNLRNTVDNHNVDLTDALSWGQLKSKRWLISELENLNLDLGNVFLCAGWYALLSVMLFDSSCKTNNIRSFDIDKTCASIAETINRHWVKDNWKFKASTLDIHHLGYDNFEYKSLRHNGSKLSLIDTANTVINTSCEHIEYFNSWYSKIPTGKLVVLQSNNFCEIEEHVNCVNSVEEFKASAPMSTLMYSGELKLEKYSRYMLIGTK